MRSTLRVALSLVVVAMAPATVTGQQATNRPPRILWNTVPRAEPSGDLPTVTGSAPLTVHFGLCQSDDPDQILLEDGREDPRGDTLNWQFHFGDNPANPAPFVNGVFRPDFDRFCRVEHTYSAGTYVATLSVTDKHLEDQGSRVGALARATAQVRIVVNRAPEGAGPAPAAPTGPCGGGNCVVFVTSGEGYQGNLGGLAGADDLCASHAASANLAGEFKAWLSDGVDSPSTRFTQSTRPYVLVDGTTIAADWSDLTNGDLIEPINVDENGSSNPRFEWVWTSTTSNGSSFPGPSNLVSCSAWTSSANSFLRRGVYGYPGASASFLWTDSLLSLRCNQRLGLYCFQQ